jgi:O-antigen/teichoic acid export membrane protein
MSISTVERSGLLGSALRIASGTALGQAWVVLATPLLSRLYAPADFGVFGLFAAFVAVASVAATLRLEMGLPSATDESAALDLLAAIAWLSVPVAASLAALLWLLADLGAFGFRELPPQSAWLAGPAILAIGIAGALRYLQTRRLAFGLIGRAQSTQGLGRALGPLACWPLLPGWAGLALGDTLGRLVGLRPLAAGVARPLLERLRTFRAADLRHTLHTHRRYLQVLLPSSLVDAAAVALPLPLITHLFGLAAAGEYALVARVAAVPGALVGNSIADAFHGHVVEWLQRRDGSARAGFASTARRLGLAAVSIYLPAAALAPALFPLVFGEQWSRAGWVFVAMVPMLAAGLVVSPLSRVLIVTDRMHWKLVVDLLFLLLPCAALWLAATRGSIVALAAYALTGALIFGLYGWLLHRAVRAADGPR